jgi:hypothetical protein
MLFLRLKSSPPVSDEISSSWQSHLAENPNNRPWNFLGCTSVLHVQQRGDVSSSCYFTQRLLPRRVCNLRFWRLSALSLAALPCKAGMRLKDSIVVGFELSCQSRINTRFSVAALGYGYEDTFDRSWCPPVPWQTCWTPYFCLRLFRSRLGWVKRVQIANYGIVLNYILSLQ